MKSKELYDFISNGIASAVKDYEIDSITSIILENYFDCNVVNVIKNTDVGIEESKIIDILNEVKYRLGMGEPIQYIVGRCKFLNCTILLNRHVFIPRQETEEMVYSILKNGICGKKILDVCSGSGCIGISLKKNFKSLDVTCLEIDRNAIIKSQESAKLNDIYINFINLDIFDDMVLSIGHYDLIVSNPPYVLESEKKYMSDRVMSYEPSKAIFVSDNDPLVFYKRLKVIIESSLNNGGRFFLEINENFANDILLLFSCNNIKNVKINSDLNGKNRWISGQV